MDLIRLVISKPVGVTVGVILAVMFGIIGLRTIPIQLTPTVDRPEITVSTVWPGRSPQEMVDEITRPQEEELKNVAGLKRMRSTSQTGMSTIVLEFSVGVDVGRVFQEVSDSLRQVSDYPDEVIEPTIAVADGAAENAIAWIIIDLPKDAIERYPDFDITTLFDALDDEVKPLIERVNGVAEVNVYGGREREVRVYADPIRLAERRLTYGDLMSALRGENQNVSAGSIAEGKREYRVRVEGEFTDTEHILGTVISYRDGLPVYVRDVASVEIAHQKQRGFVRSLGHPSIAINVIRQSDANVVEVMKDVRIALDDVRETVLPNIGGIVNGSPVGQDLRMRQVYDETTYIDSAMTLVQQNLLLGGAIAAFVLLLFLRAIRPTIIVLVAIPVSVMCTFLVMWALDRTLNVVSLAGLAFAVGMVVDNAIVVLENIYRRLQHGDDPDEAAYRGTREVWGAVLASTLTTAAVFIPVLTIQEEAGQLFRDIAIAIIASVTLSLVVSITVIPSACARNLRIIEHRSAIGRAFAGLFGLSWVFGKVGDGLQTAVRWGITGWRGASIRPVLIVGMTWASLALSAHLMPPLDYLPAGNRNLVFGGLLIPPGLSLGQQERIAQTIESSIGPYAEATLAKPETVAALPPIFRYQDPENPFDPVPMDNFFIGAFDGGMFVGATSEDEEVVIPVGTLLTNAMSSIPDSYGGARQTSLFGRGVGGGNSIDIEIAGPDLDKVVEVANYMFMAAAGEFGFGSVQADPANFNLQEQEFQIRLLERGRELGISTEALGVATRALFDGAYVGEFKLDGDAVDLTIMPPGGRLAFKEQLADIPIATAFGDVVPIDTVVEFVPTLAAQTIKRIEELASVSISVSPPTGEAIESVMQRIDEKIIGPARQAGMIDRSMRIRLEGTAAQLDEIKHAMFGKVDDQRGPIATGARWSAIGVLGLGLIVGGFCLTRLRRGVKILYGAAGCVLMSAIFAGLIWLVASQPQLLEARFVWALVVTYLLMAALFESFLYPMVIMFTVPLAVVGGFAGLDQVHEWSIHDLTKPTQQLDVLTMLGFFILIGVVVNSAILLVHQALNFIRDENLSPAEAISRSVRTRMRPIFMSVLTSVGGMLPLVIAPGAGSEMYRGLGSVVVGGLLVSTVFTLVLVPLLFSLVLEMREGAALAFRPPDRAVKPSSTPQVQPS